MNVTIKKEYLMAVWLYLVPFFSCGATPLEHPALKLLDGIPWAIDGTTIWEMMAIRQGILKILHGVLNKQTNSYEGAYSFRGVRYSLHELAQWEKAFQEEHAQKKKNLEQQFIDREAQAACSEELQEMLAMLEEQFQQDCQEQLRTIECTLEQDEAVVREQLVVQESLYRSYQCQVYQEEEHIIQKYIANKDTFHDAYIRIRQECEMLEEELAEVFIQIKHDVLNVLAPFRKKMALAKKFLEQLVGEFCRKRQRNKSFLMRWTMIADGQEFVIFNRAMTNCQLLDNFCNDLRDFLKDVIESCPKGWQQFLELSKPKQ